MAICAAWFIEGGQIKEGNLGKVNIILHAQIKKRKTLSCDDTVGKMKG